MRHEKASCWTSADREAHGQCLHRINGKFRAECRNVHWFFSLDEAQAKMVEWNRDHYEFRPPGPIGHKPPLLNMNAQKLTGRP